MSSRYLEFLSAKYPVMTVATKADSHVLGGCLLIAETMNARG